VAARSKAQVCGRSPTEIMGLNPTGAYMFVCCECCVFSGRCLRGELITCPEESYRQWCVVMCDIEISRMRRSWPVLRWVAAPQQKKNTPNNINSSGKITIKVLVYLRIMYKSLSGHWIYWPEVFGVYLVLPDYELTTWIEHSHSWEADSLSASQENSCVLWKPKVYYRIHQSSPD
jgi:hypothetical protein